MASRTALMVGLPASGKTTFLAALWHQLESSEVPTAFTADTLQDDREYLNRIREKWLSFEEIPRTPTGGVREAQLKLRHVVSGEKIDLTIPDVAGEVFAGQWRDRQASRAYLDYLESSFGLLLFVHCGDVIKPQRLSGIPTTSSSNDDDDSEIEEWEPSLAPTQVQLVDLLQTALDVFEQPGVMRVSIIVSAWDLIPETTTPPAWLERNLPFLDQFCRANRSSFASKVFGVSAIGGELVNKEALALTPSPSSRVRVYDGSEPYRDLSLTLEFLTKTGAES